MTNTLGARLKAAREAAGLSQLDVSLRLEVDTTTISRWENDRLFGGLPRLVQLAEMYGVRPGWLAFGDHDGPRSLPAVPAESA